MYLIGRVAGNITDAKLNNKPVMIRMDEVTAIIFTDTGSGNVTVGNSSLDVVEIQFMNSFFAALNTLRQLLDE